LFDLSRDLLMPTDSDAGDRLPDPENVRGKIPSSLAPELKLKRRAHAGAWFSRSGSILATMQSLSTVVGLGILYIDIDQH
jgi:hypothetical protein